MTRRAPPRTIARRLLALTALAMLPSLARAQAEQPPGLHWESMAFDQARGRLFLFGGVGRDGVYLSETWQWDGTRWSTLVDSASSPGPRSGHAMAYDAARSRVILFGGTLAERDTPLGPVKSTIRFCDTWALKGTTWTRIDRGACVIDGVVATSIVDRGTRGGLLLVEEPPRPAAGDSLTRLRLWRWADTTWALVDSSGPHPWRGRTGVAFDAARSVLVVPVLGGPDAGVWEWDGARWRHVRVAGPPIRESYALSYDSRRKQVALVGGVVPASNQMQVGIHQWPTDHWTWDGSTWTEMPSNVMVQPTGRAFATLLDDPRGGRLLYVGGINMRGVPRTLWFFDRDGWRGWSPAPER